MGWKKLVAMDEPTVVAKPLLDPNVVEDGQSDRCLPGPTSTDERDGCGAVYETNDLLDQFVASKQGSWRWRWRFPGAAR